MIERIAKAESSRDCQDSRQHKMQKTPRRSFGGFLKTAYIRGKGKKGTAYLLAYLPAR